jgi:hypothetical protein
VPDSDKLRSPMVTTHEPFRRLATARTDSFSEPGTAPHQLTATLPPGGRRRAAPAARAIRVRCPPQNNARAGPFRVITAATGTCLGLGSDATEYVQKSFLCRPGNGPGPGAGARGSIILISSSRLQVRVTLTARFDRLGILRPRPRLPGPVLSITDDSDGLGLGSSLSHSG